MVTEEDAQRAKEITAEIHVAGAEARKSIEVAKVEAVAARRRDGYWWLIMVLTAFSFAAVSVLFSWHNTNTSEHKFCALVATTLDSSERRLAAYQAEPPSTPAGVAQKAEVVTSVNDLRTLKRDLGCPPE